MSDLYIDCIGDSLTAGVVSPTYPQILRKKIKEEAQLDVEVRNRGKHGFTVADYAEFQLKPISRKIMSTRQPDFILIMLGTNNTRSSINTPIEQLRVHYLRLIQSCKQTAHKANLILGLLPPYNGPVKIKWEGSLHLFDASYRIPNEINPLIKEIASSNNLEWTDCYTPIKTAGPAIFTDGIHFNQEGNRLLADIWYQKILELMLVRQL